MICPRRCAVAGGVDVNLAAFSRVDLVQAGDGRDSGGIALVSVDEDGVVRCVEHGQASVRRA